MSKEAVFYLASQSPRRKSLLTDWGYDFEVIPKNDLPSVDEIRKPSENPVEYVSRVTREKAQWGVQSFERLGWKPLPVLASDTTVAYGDEILGKPADKEEAFRFLKMLSGSSHQVFTSVAMIGPDGTLSQQLSPSTVYFRKISDEEIKQYIATGECMDKAGAYGIQGLAGSFVLSITGSFTGIMGLPMLETVSLLKEFGIPLFKN